MRHFIVCTIGATIAAIVIGCGPGKELPSEASHKKESVGIPPDPGGKAPATSDPEAKAIADRAIKAITQNQPDLLAKAKICKLTAHGVFQMPDNPKTEAKCSIQTVWPDRALVIYNFGATQKQTFGLRSPFGWFVNSTAPYTPPSNPTEIAQIIRTDVMAHQWLLLGLGLADSQAIFFEPEKSKSEKNSTSIIKIGGFTDQPIYRVSFDDKTGLPRRIEYSPLEIGQRVRFRKVVTVADPSASSGLMLPTSIEMTQNDQLAYHWSVDSWEFPEKIDDAIFDAPK